MNKKYTIVDREVETNGIKHTIKYMQMLPEMCKECKVNERRNGSCRCQSCADKYKNE